MRVIVSLVMLLVAFAMAPCAADENIARVTMMSAGRLRTYYLFVPHKARERAPAPLLVLLHGSGRRGNSLVERWEGMAKKEGIILVGPDSLDLQAWKIPEDGPDFIHELAEELRKRYQIDGRRIYLFGHSAGARHAIYLAVMQSQYFAASAIHATALNQSLPVWLNPAPRSIPIAMWVGTNDDRFAQRIARATRNLLNSTGYPVTLIEIAGRAHDYDARSGEINRRTWVFLQQHQLPSDPTYRFYR